MKRRHSQPRRGVLLLVILALLAMFAMVAVAFVVLTRQERINAESYHRVGWDDLRPEKDIEGALGIVLRGPSVPVGPDAKQPTCALISGSLLEKIYGHDSVTGVAATVVGPACGGALVELGVSYPRNPDPPAGSSLDPRTMKLDIARRIGCLLTVTGPAGCPAIGQTTRIVGMNPRTFTVNPDGSGGENPNPNFHVMAFENGYVPAVGETLVCMISNLPYSGMGYGYNPATACVDLPAPDGGRPVALLPRHRLNWDWTQRDGLRGGANCEYTAPDFQDPLLGWQVPRNRVVTTPIPSLHPRDLIKYWSAKESNWATNAELLRLIMFRPNSVDHPKFTGSNPLFNPIWDGITSGDGQWDVDNDGDGLPDSVWVDLGFPVRWTADGRAYKPLFAVLCVDMDGRLNLNAHGQLAHTAVTQDPGIETYDYGQLIRGEAPGVPGAQITGPNGTLLTRAVNVPRGQDCGPAGINLMPILGFDPAGGVTEPYNAIGLERYRRLLQGGPDPNQPTQMLSGRYGEFGISNPGAPIPYKPQLSGGVWGPRVGPQGWNSWLNYSGWHWNFSTQRWDAYGTPPDTQGFGAMVFDPAGRPLYLGSLFLPGFGSPSVANGPNCVSMGGFIANTPYDIDLTTSAAHATSAVDFTRLVQDEAKTGVPNTFPADNPFSPSELERVLRPFDRDTAGLSGRLAALISFDPVNERWKRTQVTTESWDVPVINTMLPYLLRKELATVGDRPRHFIDWLRTRPTPIPLDKWPHLFPQDLLSGLRMNLNRPVGLVAAVRNPTGDYVPQVAFQAQVPYVTQTTLADQKTTTALLRLDPAGNHLYPPPAVPPATAIPPDPYTPMKEVVRARQIMARYLYCLATMLRRPPAPFVTPQGISRPIGELQAFTSETNLQGNVAVQQRRLAQWAINAVSFCTNDSIMVPFKYPINPFDPAWPGWCIDGPLTPGAADPKGLNRLYDPYRVDLNTYNGDADPTKPYLCSQPGRACDVVWGCKPAELLITETLAFHDRRAADTDQAGSGDKKRTDPMDDPANPGKKIPADPHLDQARIPQGSLFFELYCPRSPFNTAAPPDLYAYDPFNAADPLEKKWHLHIGMLAPPSLDDKGQPFGRYPVWRVVVSEGTRPTPARPETGVKHNNVGYRLTGDGGRFSTANSIPGRVFTPDPSIVKPDTCSLQPLQAVTPRPYGDPISDGFNLLGASAGQPPSQKPQEPVRIERIIWLAAVPPPDVAFEPDRKRIYYNRNVDPTRPFGQFLAAGQYALVGPRPSTSIGSDCDQPPTGTTLGKPSAHRINIIHDPANLRQFPPDACVTGWKNHSPMQTLYKMTAPAQIRPVLGIVCAADWPESWTNSAHAKAMNGVLKDGVGISVSEPTPDKYYMPEPTVRAATLLTDASLTPRPVLGIDGKQPMEWYDDPGAPTGKFLSQPLERAGASYPIAEEGLSKTATYFNYKTLFLQRLANPLLPYQPDPNDTATDSDPDPQKRKTPYNPYITVDWMPVDLTVFNGEMKHPPWPPTFAPTLQLPWDLEDPNPDTTKPQVPVDQVGQTCFGTRQRGLTTLSDFNIWKPLSDPPPKSVPMVTSGNAPPPTVKTAFNCELMPPTAASMGQHSLGHVNKAFAVAGGGGLNVAPYTGDPKQPFPWITWNARPYASPMELMQVPATSAVRLGWEFTWALPNVDYYLYEAITQNDFDGRPCFPYNHLLNFFNSTRDDPAVEDRNTNRPYDATNKLGGALPGGNVLLRILDYTRVPSRFVKTEIPINPQAAAAGTGNDHWFHAPFNFISAYREPGRVNPNTIASKEVLQGLFNYWPYLADNPNTKTPPSPGMMNAFWNGFVVSRRAQQVADNYDPAAPPDPRFPSRFGRMFRSATGIELQPMLGDRSILNPWQPRHEDDVTILRHGELPGVPDPSAQRSGERWPFFLPRLNVIGNNNQPYFDWAKSSYCRFLPLHHLANTTTNRSNVFAVWITVGYFEVKPWRGGADAGHPDGWELDQEVGMDTGQVERHRGFYLIDRSIPVGFQRGQDVNSERAVLIRRYIE